MHGHDQADRKRFSDEKLDAFYQEFLEHMRKEHAFQQQERDFHQSIKDFVEANTDAVADLKRSTESLIEAWNAAQGAIVVLRWLGNSVKWVSSVLFAGLALYYAVKTALGK